MNPIKSLGNDELLTKTHALVAEERRVTLELLHHLREIERRRLHAIRGYPTLFEYLVKALGYSDGAAFRRIGAMRLLQDLPEVEEAIQEGKMSLTTASTLQS